MATGGVLTNGGRQLMLSRLYGSTQTAIATCDVGTGTNTPAASDVALQTPLGLVLPFSAAYVDTVNNRSVATVTLSASQGNGSTITEIGEKNADGSPVLVSHDVFTGIAKTSAKILTFTIIHQLT